MEVFILALIARWERSSNDRLGLDILLWKAPSPQSQLCERLDWLRSLVRWVRTVGPNAKDLGFGKMQIQGARIKYLLQVLDHHLDLKLEISKTLQSILKDTKALELFMNVGIPNHQGFLGEFMERLSLMLLPVAPHSLDLVSVFSEMFRLEDDSDWIRQIHVGIFQGCIELFRGPTEKKGDHKFSSEKKEDGIIQDARDAIFLLSHSTRTIGLSRLVRNRVNASDYRNIPFFILTDSVETFLKKEHVSEAAFIQAYWELVGVIDRCSETIEEVSSHFRNQGVSLSLVYQIERLKTLLERIRILARLLVGYRYEASFIQEFICLLIQENRKVRSLRNLFEENISVVCRKIVETNAEVGEHYITRNSVEYLAILKRALGGGVITAGTTLVKCAIHLIHSAPFFLGCLSFLNFGIGFVGIQLMGFTLATKQPAMTATVLAAKIEQGKNSYDELVEEVIFLFRSQLAAVLGNVVAVIPAVMILNSLILRLGFHIGDPAYAQQTIRSYSLFGMTPIYAAWTGILLWVSSVFAGWVHNWFHFRRLPEAIEVHSRLNYVLGRYRVSRFMGFLTKNIAGFAANLSLAFLLAMSPHVASFFGLPLDVRHVTLSSGSLTLAVLSLGSEVFSQASFWLAVAGIVSMAVLNLGVSFSLALMVALWAKRASAPKWEIVCPLIMKRWLGRPWTFLFPVS